MHSSSPYLPHQRHNAYRLALELLAAVRTANITDRKLRDEALRASKSACLNIAEALGRGTRPRGAVPLHTPSPLDFLPDALGVTLRRRQCAAAIERMLSLANRCFGMALVLAGGCGQTNGRDSENGAAGAKQNASSGASGTGNPVELYDAALPEACETSELRIASGDETAVFDTGYREQLVWLTSWDSFYVRTHTLPLSEGGLIAGWGRGGARFAEGEVRNLDKTILMLSDTPETLYCAGGNRRVIASGGKGYAVFDGLNPLGCGEPVEGSLTYCSSQFCDDPIHDSYMLHGTLGGDEKRFVTGEKDSVTRSST